MGDLLLIVIVAIALAVALAAGALAVALRSLRLTDAEIVERASEDPWW